MMYYIFISSVIIAIASLSLYGLAGLASMLLMATKEQERVLEKVSSISLGSGTISCCVTILSWAVLK
jgi:hypothetical protein